MEAINVDLTCWNILPNSILYNNEVWGDLSPDFRLYFMFVDKVTELYEEEGITYGKVLGGKRLSYRQLGTVLNLSWSCIRHCVERLEERNLIRTIAGERREALAYEVVNCTKTLKEKSEYAAKLEAKRKGKKAVRIKPEQPSPEQKQESGLLGAWVDECTSAEDFALVWHRSMEQNPYADPKKVPKNWRTLWTQDFAKLLEKKWELGTVHTIIAFSQSPEQCRYYVRPSVFVENFERLVDRAGKTWKEGDPSPKWWTDYLNHGEPDSPAPASEPFDIEGPEEELDEPSPVFTLDEEEE